MMGICIPSCLDEKDADIAVYDEPRLHLAWGIGDKVLVAEWIPKNWPGFILVVFDSWQEYYNAIRDVDWIMRNLEPKHIRFLRSKGVDLGDVYIGQIG